MKRKPSSSKVSKPKVNPPSRKAHDWRLCPVGEHWVTTHPLRVPPSKSNPQGSVTTRHGHCASNPTGKDQLYPDEILEMSKDHFSRVKQRPCPIDLGFAGKGDKYDELIAGWVQYWNDIFGPKEPLDPNLVKALIATESSFNPELLANKKNQNSARGLMQVTNHTRKILGNEKGELKDQYLTVTRQDLDDPNINICAGVRWLFHKQKLTSARLGREATWEEAVYEYKGGRTATEKRSKELMKRFSEKLKELQRCGKK